MVNVDELVEQCVFKYRRVDDPRQRPDYSFSNDRDVQLLLKRQLWFSDRAGLNDEAEMRPRVVFRRGATISRGMIDTYLASEFPDASPTELEEYRASMAAEVAQPGSNDAVQTALEGTLDSLLAASVICSFCRSPDIPAVWAHYANGYRGYALGFDADHPQPPAPMGLVHYQEEYPTVDGDDLLNLQNQVEFGRGCYFTKNTSWKFEEEVRMLLRGSPGPREYPADMLKMVVIGSQMLPDDREKILLLARHAPSKPAIFTAKTQPGDYRLKLMPVE